MTTSELKGYMKERLDTQDKVLEKQDKVLATLILIMRRFRGSRTNRVTRNRLDTHVVANQDQEIGRLWVADFLRQRRSNGSRHQQDAGQYFLHHYFFTVRTETYSPLWS